MNTAGKLLCTALVLLAWTCFAHSQIDRDHYTIRLWLRRLAWTLFAGMAGSLIGAIWQNA